MTNIRVIAFCGPKTCGKDTAASALFKQNDIDEKKFYFRRAPFAEGVKNVCREFFGWTLEQMDDSAFKETAIPFWPGGPVMAPRWPMMDIANFLRDKYGPDIHAQRWQRQAEIFNAPGIAHVVTDLRFPNELEFMRANNALVIYVHREEAEQALEKAQAAGDSMALNPSEAHYTILRRYAEDYGVVIHNDGQIHELQHKAVACVNNRLGHWKYWEATDMEVGTEEEVEENNG